MNTYSHQSPVDRQSTDLLKAEISAFALLAQEQGLQSAMTTLLRAVEQAADHEFIASAWVVDQSLSRIKFCAGPRLHPRYWGLTDGFPLTPTAGSCGRAIHTRQPVVVPDIELSDLWTSQAEVLREVGIRASWSTPILAADGRVLGTFAVYYFNPTEPSTPHRHLIERVIQTAAVLIERQQGDAALQAREAALRDSEERLRRERALLTTITDATDVMLVYLDRAFNFVWVNAAYAATCRCGPSDLIGKNHFALYPDEDNERIFCRVRDSGEPVFFKDKPFTFPDQPERGTTYWDWSLVPVKGNDGHVTALVFSLRETTPYKLAQIALAESEERFRRLVEVSSQIVWTTDEAGVPREDSPSWRAFTGYRLEQWVSTDEWVTVFHPDDRERLHSVWREAVETGSPYVVEARMRRADGVYRHVVARALPLSNADGTVRQWVGMTSDVTERKQAEEALLDSEERLRMALAAGQMGAWDVNLATGVVSWDAKQYEIFGRAPSDPPATMDEWYAMVHPEDGERVRRAFLAAQSTGRFSEEFRIIRPDGRIRWLVGQGVVVKDRRGRPVRIVGLNNDITERKTQEAERDRLRHELQLILDNAPTLIWYKDTNNRIVRVNRLAADSIGLPRDRIEGHRTEEFYPDDADRYYLDDALVAGTGQPRMGIIEPYQLPSGERRWVQTDKIPLKDEGGKVTGVLVFAQDVTGRKLAEEALRASEERLRLALAAGQMGAWDIDLDTGDVTWDAAQYDIFGRAPTGAGVTMEEFFAMLHPDDVRRVRDAADASRSTGRFHEEFRVIRPDGRLRWISGQGAIITDAHGRPARMVGVNDDITERKEAQTRIERFAEELEREVAERTGELVHSQERLRSLATELTLAEQRERNRLATELHDHLQQLLVLCKLQLGQGKRVLEKDSRCTQLLCDLDETIGQALTYSRSLVAELSPPVLREFGLVPSLKWLREWMRQMNLAVAVDVEGNPAVSLAEAPAVLLFQSVRELLINAAKYAGTGRATVRVAERNGWLRIDVADEGNGFDVALATGDLPSLAGSPLSSKFGLLSIRERMTALGGGLEIVSALGLGTTASLLMPVTDVAQPEVGPSDSRNLDMPYRPAMSAALQAAVSGEKASIRVLLADDHAMMRQGLRSVLDAYPDLEIVGEASDGEEAVACVEQLRPSVVVMDINMPKKNGIDATALITSRFPDTAVIGLSVNASGQNAEAMQKAGARMVLTKEAAVEQLYDSIQEAMNR